MPVFPCSAILFDLDGVLVDSTRQVDREWREWALRKGVNGDAVMAIAHGVRTIEVIRRVAPHLDAAAEAAALENHEAHDQRGVAVMPGAKDLLKSIPEGRWGVVTSGSRMLAKNRLRHCGLPVPAVLVTSNDVVNGKPHPEPYLKGAAALRLKPVECLVVEDAPAGIHAAHAGGMKVIGLASTYELAKLTEANAVIPALRDAVVRVVEGGLIVSTPAVDGHRTSLTIQKATVADCGEMARLINSAFAIEKLLEGDRTNEYELQQRMQKGEFLLGSDASGLVASVYVEVRGTRGYFGMLAVEPKRQGKGLGRKMVEAAEDYCREKGCGAMDLTVLSLRRELPPLYQKLGYAETGVEEFHPGRAFLKGVRECHRIVMSKKLRSL